MGQKILIQLGHSRDGGRYYCHPAQSRGLAIALIDGPAGRAAYDQGQARGEPAFDFMEFLPLAEPEDYREAVLRLAEQGEIAAVVPGFELHVPLARQAYDWLGLAAPNPADTLTRLRFKSLQREWLRDHVPDVTQPRFAVCRNPLEFEREIARTEFPAVLKLDDSGGSLGVCRVDSRAEGTARYAELLQIIRDDGKPTHGIVLVEALVDGPEFSLQGVVNGAGEVQLLAMSRKSIVHGASGDRFLERQHVICPPAAISAEFHGFARHVINGLDLRASPFHLDLRLSEDGPVLIEAGARLSGAGVPRLIRLATGREWADAALAVTLGEPLQLRKTCERYAGLRFVTPEAMDAGTLQLDLAAMARAERGETLALTIQAGNGSGSYGHISDRLGAVEASADSLERVEALLDGAWAGLRPSREAN
jgi:biotin carboxylase